MEEAVVASKQERPNVIESNDKTSKFIFDENQQSEHNFSTLVWLEEVVLSFGSNVKGRIASFQKLTKAKQKSAILLSESSMNIYFPVRGLNSQENYWLFYNSIYAYHANGSDKTNVYFSNGFIYEVPVNYRVIASQMKRCDLFNKCLNENKIRPTMKFTY